MAEIFAAGAGAGLRLEEGIRLPRRYNARMENLLGQDAAGLAHRIEWVVVDAVQQLLWCLVWCSGSPKKQEQEC